MCFLMAKLPQAGLIHRWMGPQQNWRITAMHSCITQMTGTFWDTSRTHMQSFTTLATTMHGRAMEEQLSTQGEHFQTVEELSLPAKGGSLPKPFLVLGQHDEVMTLNLPYLFAVDLILFVQSLLCWTWDSLTSNDLSQTLAFHESSMNLCQRD